MTVYVRKVRYRDPTSGQVAELHLEFTRAVQLLDNVGVSRVAARSARNRAQRLFNEINDLGISWTGNPAIVEAYRRFMLLDASVSAGDASRRATRDDYQDLPYATLGSSVERCAATYVDSVVEGTCEAAGAVQREFTPPEYVPVDVLRGRILDVARAAGAVASGPTARGGRGKTRTHRSYHVRQMRRIADMCTDIAQCMLETDNALDALRHRLSL